MLAFLYELHVGNASLHVVHSVTRLRTPGANAFHTRLYFDVLGSFLLKMNADVFSQKTDFIRRRTTKTVPGFWIPFGLPRTFRRRCGIPECPWKRHRVLCLVHSPHPVGQVVEELAFGRHVGDAMGGSYGHLVETLRLDSGLA
ncbi:hypothetical protein RvY_08062-2 [Ramazzottius varieornatus]|nr:hypothetical protein RvY_08062-2 [Ramazzottius varieornatus]